MKCKQVYRHICDNLDENLHSAKCRQVRKHLASCPDCTTFLDSVKKTVHLYRSAPSPDLSLTAQERLFKTISRTWESNPRKGRQRTRR